jgi:hypothetical protein
MCDSSGAGRNGTYASSGLKYGVTGIVSDDRAVTASSSSSGVGTGATGLVGNHSFTLEAWFRSTGTIQGESLVNMGQAGEGNIAGLSIWTSNTGDGGLSQLALDLYVGVPYASTLPIWNTQTAGVNLWDGHWHYVVVTYNARTGAATGYVDGHDLGARTPPTKVNLLAGPIRVGYWVDSYLNHPVIGVEDEVAVYPAALSPAQVKAHFVASGRRFR